MWSRDAGHQYNIFKSKLGIAAENLFVLTCALQNHRCAQCFGYFQLNLYNYRWKRLCHGDSSSLMWLSTTWCDFLYRRRAMGMMWLFPHDVTWARRSYYVLFAEVVPTYFSFSLHGGNVPLVIPLTYLFWMGGTFVFFIWWFGVKKGCGGAGSSALHVVVNALDNSWIRGRSGGRSGVVRGVVRLYVQHLFSFVFFVCSFFLSSSLSFSQTVTSSLFIVSFVHSVLLPLNSNHCGRMIVCNAKQCWQKSSLQCEGWALSCLL